MLKMTSIFHINEFVMFIYVIQSVLKVCWQYLYMNLGLELRPAIRQDLRQVQEQRLLQTLDCTLQIRQELQDPLETARALFESSPKVNVPIKIGIYTIIINAAIVSEEELVRLFENERFAGIISRSEERYQFFNRHLRVPKEITSFLPQLMAFHCLAAIHVSSFGDETGTLNQYQAIALEMAYAKTLFSDKQYAIYENWRQTIERTDFFKRSDWRDIFARVSARFRDFIEEMHRNAHKAMFVVAQNGERFKLTAGRAISASGEQVPFVRKRLVK